MQILLDIFNLIKYNLAGLAIGAIAALLLCLILKLIVFKDKSIMLLTLILTTLFGVCGMLIQNTWFKKELTLPTPQEQITSIDATIGATWKNTNGGFTFDQIIASQNDNECPSYNDQIIGLQCYDFGSYICFAYKDGKINQNLIFIKTENGLVLDGVINMQARFTEEYFSVFSPYFMQWAAKVNSFEWVDERTNTIMYEKNTRIFAPDYDNLVSVSRQTTDFVTNYTFGYGNQKELDAKALKEAPIMTAENATSHFIKFNNVELIGSAESGLVKINSFYNYLYEQVKGIGYNNTKMVDATNTLCLPIPAEEQTNYPVSNEFKAQYPDIEYYGVYRCNIAVECTFLKGNSTLIKTSKNDDYINKIAKDEETKDKIKVETIISNNNYSKLNIKFNQEKESDLSNIDIITKPIKIAFSCEELNSTKQIEINSLDKLLSGIETVFNTNVEWKFFIDSKELIFEDFNGTFKLTENKNEITFDYYYLENYVIANVGLNAIGTIDETKIDLAINPVKIILSNDKHTYQFEFKSNSDLNLYQSLLVELGEYDYTILSDQLIFASVTGKLTITNTDKTMLFNYAQSLEENDLKFTISILNTGSVNNRFELYSASTNVDLIRNTLGGNQIYNVICVIYDKDGKLLETFNHTHFSIGNCSATWTASNLIAGEQYILQLRFTDSSDTTKTYLSDIAEFTFNQNTTFQVEYNVQQI